MTATRLDLANNLRTRPGDNAKGARMINCFPDKAIAGVVCRKRPGVASTGLNSGASPQMLGSILEAKTGVGFTTGGGTAINESSGVVTAATWTSSSKTTLDNCASITPVVRFLSYVGNGVGQWYRRSVRWRVEHYNGSTWVAGTYRTVSIGDQYVNEVQDSASYTFPSAGIWQWRIYAEAFNTDGSVFGAVTYTYSSTTVTASNVSQALYIAPAGSGQAAYPTYGAATGSGEIYQITYYATPQITASIASGSLSFWLVSLASGYSSGTHYKVQANNNHVNSSWAVIANATAGGSINLTTSPASWSPGQQSSTVTGSNLTFNQKYWSLGTDTNTGGAYISGTLSLTGLSATIYRRTPVANSTTVNNLFKVESAAYVISGAGTSDQQVEDVTKAVIVISGDTISIVDLGGLP